MLLRSECRALGGQLLIYFIKFILASAFLKIENKLEEGRAKNRDRFDYRQIAMMDRSVINYTSMTILKCFDPRLMKF